MSNIRIKKGSYSNIGNLQDGDLGFAKYDNNNGTFIIKDGNTTFYTLPKPGKSGSLLIGRGLNAAPSYTTGHFVNDTKIAINSTAEPTENFYVNGNSQFNGNILPAATSNIIGSSDSRWNTLYVNTLMARNGNSIISEKDYETDCNTDCMIRIDSHINKGEDYNLNFSALPPYGNNANTLITVNRHSGKYITQLGLTSKGIFYRLGEAAVPTKDKEWNQLIYREVKTGSGFSAVGSTTLPVYVDTDGKVVACTASSVFSSLSWTAGNTNGLALSVTIAGQNRTSTIPSASSTASGIVTTGAQTFAGDKTFTGAILPQTDITQSIGSLTQAFNTIYTKSLYLKGTNSKFNYIVSDNDTTDENYYAKLPKHNGKITISISGHFNADTATTYFMPFYTTKGEAISYNNGLRYYTEKGTDSTIGLGELILGNEITDTPDNNKKGILRLYGSNEYYTNIYTENLIANRSINIRDYGIDTTYFVGVDGVDGKGNTTTPIYIANTGLATACDGVIITSGEQTFSGNKIFSDNLTIHSMNVNSNSIYSTTSETYSLGTETSFFSNEYVNTLNIGQVENYISLKVDQNIGKLSSIYLPNITEDSRLLYIKKDIQLGSPTQPIYINNKGEAIASTQNIGNDAIPMYLKDGVFSAMSKSIGATNQPVYFDKTTGFSPIKCMAISYGGTGLTSFETNKLYRYNGEKLIDTAHVIEEDKIYTDNQSMTNCLGSCYGDNKYIYFSGNRSNGQRSLSDSGYGDIINFTTNNIPKIHGIFCSHSTNYGTAEPTAASPIAEEGALYFQIIS